MVYTCTYVRNHCMLAELEMGLFLWLLFCTLTEVSSSTRYLSGLFTSLFVISTPLYLARLAPGGF